MAARAAALRLHGHRSTEYTDLNRHVRSAIRSDTKLDIAERIQQQGPHTVFRNIRNIVGGKRDSCAVTPTTDPDTVNDFFVNVGPRVTAELAARGAARYLPVRLPRVGACGFTVRPVSLQCLHRTILSMRNSAACGDDGLCIGIFKMSFPCVGHVLLHIVNECLITCDIPSSWKHALVQPIFKSGDPADPSSFRPISILPVISKLIEKIVQRQLHHYLASNHLLASTQHGFRPQHSTETALLTMSDKILSAMDQSEISLLCLIDLSKCFDVINHSKLLTKLQLHGIDIKWFQNYLSGHTQSVRLPSSSAVSQNSSSRISAARPINQGIFQGSSLGPLLYTIFCNDLGLYGNGSFIVQYADDTQVLVSGKKSVLSDLVSELETTLSSLDAYFHFNGLKVNESKFEILAIGSQQNLRGLPKFSVKFRQTTITPCTEARNLGVTFDRHLTWDTHVNAVARKCTGILVGLSHLRHYLPPNILPSLVSALVFSHVRYCLTVYGNGSNKNLAILQKILNFAARVISGKRKFDHISAERRRLGWLDTPDLLTYQTALLFHRVRCSGVPESLSCQVYRNRERPGRSHSTRQDELLSLPAGRGTAAGKRRFLYRGVTIYNALPPEFLELTVSRFKLAVKQHLVRAGHY